MKRIVVIYLFVGFLTNLSAQKESIKQPILEKNKSKEVIRKIELKKFNNRIGLEMGLAIVNLAKERNQNVAVQVDRLNHTIFLFVDDNLSADKHNWLRRKANVTKHFEESSLSVKK